MRQLDAKNRGFYDELDSDERKKFSTFLMLRWGSAVDGAQELQEYYVQSCNHYLNKHFFDIGRHPKLQWLLCTSVSPGMGRQRHYWQASKKKEGSNTKITKFLTKLYPHMKSDEIELLAEINDLKEVKELARSMGMADSEIKKELG
jgi:hypothetical protein